MWTRLGQARLKRVVERAEKRHAQGDAPAAALLFRDALSRSDDPATRVRCLLALARLERGAGDFEPALSHTLEAVRLAPTAPRVYGWLRSLVRRGPAAERALAVLDDVLAHAEVAPQAHFARGDLLLVLRRFDEAFASYRRGSARHAAETRPKLYPVADADAPRRPPDFLLLGAMKCGTTSLFRWLTSHSRIVAPARKELHYWDARTLGDERAYRLEDYLSLFPPDPGPGFLLGEGTPATLCEPIAERIARELPRARFLVALRDPAERAVSEYHHAVRNGRERRPLEEALLSGVEAVADLHGLPDDEAWRRTAALRARNRPGKPSRSYLWKGLYDVFLARWLAALPREQFWFVDFRALVSQPDEVTASAQRFLGLAPEPLPDRRALTRGGYDPATAQSVIEPLREVFAPHVRRVRLQTGVDLEGPVRAPDGA